MRAIHLKDRAVAAYDALGDAEREAVEIVFFRLMDERIPLVEPEDGSIQHGALVMGRKVPGTDLIVCYVPAGPEVHVIGLLRR